MKIQNSNKIRLHLILNSHLFPAGVVGQVPWLKPLSHLPRTFQSSAALGVPNTRHPLIWRVDWFIVQAGQYAVVDPESPQSILYLTKKEYLKLVGIALSNDSVLVVLASPYDPRPKDELIEAPKPENSPPVKTVGHAIFWRGIPSRISRSYRAFLSKGSKMFKASKLRMYLSGLVKRWSLAVCHWSGLPLTTQTWFKDILSILPHLQHVLAVQGTSGLVLESFPNTVRYGRGQPMGCLASFALLALWNHSWVQFSSWILTGKLLFSYGVTGDDVVIAERFSFTPIGKKYVDLSTRFGISISPAKSFVSGTLFNFLSRIWYGGLEVSPASIREDIHVRDTSTRVQRALRLLDRDWWNTSTNGWLAKAVKQFLYPSEYIIAANSMRKGKLEGYGLRAVLGFLSPTSSITRACGLSGVPVFGWLSAFAGSTSLLSRADLVRSNSLLPRGSKSEDLYPILLELADYILRRIAEIGHSNDLALGQYRNFTEHQCSGFFSHIGHFFLPTAEQYRAKRSGGSRWLYPAIEQGYNTVGLVSRLGDQWWLPQNIQSSILLLFQWLEGFPVARNYTDPELFSHQASMWAAARMTGEREFNQTERHMLSLLYLVTQQVKDIPSIKVNAVFTDYLERRFLDKFLGSTVNAGVE